MKKSYLNYDPVRWDKTLERQVKNCDIYPLVDIDEIQITQKELDKIRKLNNKPLERLTFTILCFAKLHNEINPKNNGWVNKPDKELFKIARTQTTIYKQSLMLNDLKTHELVEFSRVVDNVNIRVLFIDDEDEVVLHINDFRELGYEYMQWRGDKFIRCGECKILVKQRGNRTKYCKNCAATVKNQQNKNYYNLGK